MSDDFLREMIGATKLGLLDLDRVLRTAPKRYKVYQIDKRRGGKRTIAHPSKELKTLQRLLLAEKLATLPVHNDAYAYIKGKSIRDNAEQHKGRRFLLKLDFEQFFPSLKVTDWDKYICLAKCRLKLDAEDRAAFRQILFWGNGSISPNCLSIGAPSSPIVSNILMHKFDTKVVSALCRTHVRYTRYADDMTLSSDVLSSLIEAEKIIQLIVRRQRWPKLKLNDDKRGIYAKGVRQMVTGLVVTPDGSISIGRERKRLIHAMLFNFLRGQLDLADRKRLQGLIGFCISSEPEFVERLKQKYGIRNVRRAQTMK